MSTAGFRIILTQVHILCMSRQCVAGHALKTDVASTVGKKFLQLEVTPEFVLSRDRGEFSYPFMLTVGLNEHLDPVWGFRYFYINHLLVIHDKQAYLDDQSLELKWIFSKNKKWFFGIKPGLIYPVRGKTGINYIDPTLLAIISFQSGNTLLHANLGGVYNRDPSQNTTSFHISLAAEQHVTKHWNVVMNVLLEDDDNQLANTVSPEVIGGIQYLRSDKLMLDVGIGTKTFDHAMSWTIYSGITVVF